MHKNTYKKVVARNKQARYNYDFSKFLTAGIVLKGHEVKAVRQGQIALRDSFVRVEDGEVWLNNAHISKYQHANIKEYDPKVRRKLLLTQREISMLQTEQDAKRMSIIPVEIIIEGKRIKVKLGIGKGKKRYDKRQKIKEREMKLDLQRDLARKKTY